MGVLTAAVIVALALLIAAPLLAIVREAFLPLLSGGSLEDAVGHWIRSDTAVELRGTVTLACLTSVFSTGIGLLLAVMVHRSPPRGLGLVEPLLLVSFLIPPYLMAVAWSLLSGPTGQIQQAIGFGGVALAAGLYTLPGIALVMAMHLTPLVYVMVVGALRGADDRLVDCARVHGAAPWRAFWTGYRPTVLPAVAAAALLVFLATCEEFGVPKVLGDYAGVHVLSVAVEEAMNVWPVDLVRATGIGVILGIMALVLWGVVRFFEREGGTAMHVRPVRHRWWSLGVMLAFCVLAAGLPLTAILVTALQKAITAGLCHGNWTLAHFRHVLRAGGSGREALLNSVGLSVVVSLGGTVLAVVTAWVLAALPGRLTRRLEVVAYLPQAIPGVVLATGLILFWNAAWNPLPVYDHAAILGVAYLTLTFPYAMRYAASGLKQAPPSLTRAAAVHGAGPLQILRRIRLPLAWPLLVGGGTIVFALSMRELAASILLQPPGMQVVSTYVFEQFEQGSANDGMAMAVVGVLTTAVLLGLARTVLSRRR